MYCQNCGKETVDDARFCAECGVALVTADPAYPQQHCEQQSQQSALAHQYTSLQEPVFCEHFQKEDSSKKLGITGVALGVAGVVLACAPYLGVVFGTVGLIFSILGKRIDPHSELSGPPLAGIIVSAIAATISLILVTFDVMMWIITGTGFYTFRIGDLTFGLGL